MTNILLLGGTGEALQLARRISTQSRHTLTYSIAGRGRIPTDLPCTVRVSGFGGMTGLATFLHDAAIGLLIDATHPYAAQISHHAVLAAQSTHTPLVIYRRPPWQPTPADDWRSVPDWQGVLRAIAPFQRPLWTMGLLPLQRWQERPTHQHWLVRCLAGQSPDPEGLTLLCATGPFCVADELDLMRSWAIDVVVSKNSGGMAVESKIIAARMLRIPVILLDRPAAKMFSGAMNVLCAPPCKRC